MAREQYTLSPSVPAVEFTDPFGDLCQRLVAPAGPLSILTSADVAIYSQFGDPVELVQMTVQVVRLGSPS